MDLIADILLVAGALGAGLYCLVLGRRLNRFNDLEKGVGGAVAVLSAQVDDLARALAAAQSTASGSAATLTDLAERAEAISRRLELQMAALHDIPAPAVTNSSPPQRTETKNSSNPAEPMFMRHRKVEDAA
ncbi:hypothetical protein [Sulfitobacter aestuariivivens]|uniref:Uncharacterized protein n=1 Tax=Sulfitobacter aestuariivivens TaxID=2766981 RepID=A0A927D835_9RHOB|nr:hypothetical protein [Sulfitobacter aestuariivivens]MBD3665519.1 hypothetical protein [Sulfitobacter aestuariivivens]